MLRHVHADRVGADLRHHGVGALPHVDRSLIERDVPVAPKPDLDRRGVRQRSVPAAVPHAGEADAGACRATIGVRLRRRRSSALPMRTQRFQAVPIPDARCEYLTGDRRDARRERVAVAELEAIHPHGVRELIEQAFLRDRRLRHAEPTERARRWPVRVDGHGARAIRVVDVRTAGVHRAHGSPPSNPTMRMPRY